MHQSLSRKLATEFIGTSFLLATVVGSGIMAERLAGRNVAIALLGNTLATGAMLFVLILSHGPISGAHFNPAVTLVELIERRISTSVAMLYFVVQTVGAVLGVMLANAMFELPLVFASQKVRTGTSQWLSEFVATFGLVFVIAAVSRVRSQFAAPLAVAAYITAAYWFTASTSFANPAVTLARSLSDTFAGIRPIDVPAFVIAQIIGAIAAAFLGRWLFIKNENEQ